MSISVGRNELVRQTAITTPGTSGAGISGAESPVANAGLILPATLAGRLEAYRRSSGARSTTGRRLCPGRSGVEPGVTSKGLTSWSSSA